jgi:hypothetical protein
MDGSLDLPVPVLPALHSFRIHPNRQTFALNIVFQMAGNLASVSAGV